MMVSAILKNVLCKGCIFEIIIGIFVPVCHMATLENVENLHDALFVNSRYNKNIRGIEDQTQPVRVQANLTLVTLLDVNEKEEAFEVMGVLHLGWMDERLGWNPDEYNGTTSILVYQEELWKPEVNLANPVDEIEGLGNERTKIRIQNTGRLIWIIPDLLKAHCAIAVVAFPWDRQLCTLRFIVSSHLQEEVVIETGSNEIDTASFVENEQWSLLQTSIRRTTEYSSEVQFSICIERRSAFQIAVVFLPFVMLCVLNLFVCFVKADSGERISFSITILLSITLYLSAIGNNLPQHSKGTSAIIYCLDFVLFESLLVCLMSILSLHVFHKQGVPSYKLQKIVSRLHWQRPNKVGDMDDVPSVQNFQRDDISEIKSITEEESSDIGITWADVSLLLDKIFFFIALFAIVSSFITFGLFNKVECN